jgi:hypothetical protein
MAHDHLLESEQPGKVAGTLSMQEKLLKMVGFWRHHNQDHARSYRDWAGKVRAAGFEEVAVILETLAGETVLSNRDPEQLLRVMKEVTRLNLTSLPRV